MSRSSLAKKNRQARTDGSKHHDYEEHPVATHHSMVVALIPRASNSFLALAITLQGRLFRVTR